MIVRRMQSPWLLFELYFKEAEIFDAFKKLGGKDQLLQLEMRMIKTTHRPRSYGLPSFSYQSIYGVTKLFTFCTE